MMEYFTELMDNIMERVTREIREILTPEMSAEILGIIEGCIHDSFNQMLYNNLGAMSEEDSIVEYFNPDTENDIC